MTPLPSLPFGTGTCKCPLVVVGVVVEGKGGNRGQRRRRQRQRGREQGEVRRLFLALLPLLLLLPFLRPGSAMLGRRVRRKGGRD